MAKYKLYKYQDILIKAFNKEHARRKLKIPFTKLNEIQKIYCKYSKTRRKNEPN
jgi:hypothetical protein